MTLLAAHVHDLSQLTAFELLLVGLSALFVVYVIWRAVVLTVRPGEDDPHHVKRSIFDGEIPADGGVAVGSPGPEARGR